MSSCSSEHFIVEEFFNFSNDDNLTLFTDSISGNSTDSYTSIHTNNSLSVSGHQNFKPDILYDTTDLCVPYDDLAELEWLSNFEEESLSNEDLQKMQLISGIKASNDAASKNREFQPQPQPKNPTSPVFDSPVSVPAKARSKGTRGPPCDWTSRLLVLSPTMPTSIPQPNHHVIFPPKKPMPRRRDSSDQGEGRRCLHCATDKTPQWRTGPMGPKTLCNACGVRYKSGRLVPEYRPAASPTFIMTRHSNSHRKVMELRRQKEMIQAQHHQFNQHHQNMSMMYDVSSNGDEYLIHQHVGPYFT
ncbi:putative transcription factor C2C2-GATA family [Lupinus albus]|uniref:GATA transcription factor n=1 Tax=Lupinus albus TaxID=3870 RepID=A0A6A4Q4S5_LUPAL|nr:putative transcription factor C2C2-GATA family [Lupinus albus]